MTKQPHDQFAKQYLKGLLAPLGTVESSRVQRRCNRWMSGLSLRLKARLIRKC
jgi:hypothetical protein